MPVVTLIILEDTLSLFVACIRVATTVSSMNTGCAEHLTNHIPHDVGDCGLINAFELRDRNAQKRVEH